MPICARALGENKGSAARAQRMHRPGDWDLPRTRIVIIESGSACPRHPGGEAAAAAMTNVSHARYRYNIALDFRSTRDVLFFRSRSSSSFPARPSHGFVLWARARSMHRQCAITGDGRRDGCFIINARFVWFESSSAYAAAVCAAGGARLIVAPLTVILALEMWLVRAFNGFTVSVCRMWNEKILWKITLLKGVLTIASSHIYKQYFYLYKSL